MARYEFGGVMAAWVVATVASDDEFGAGTRALLVPSTDTYVPVYDAPSGSLVTDLLDSDGNVLSGLVVPAGTSIIPKFSGPDGVESLWVQGWDGTYVPVPHFTASEAGGGGGVGDVVLSGGNAYEYLDSQGAPWLTLKVPNDNSDTTEWQNRLETYYWDNSTSQYRLGFHLNEKLLLRTRGVTPSDVAARFSAHPSLDDEVPVMETTATDINDKLFQSFESKTVSTVPVVVPYLVNEQGEKLFFGTQDPSTGAHAGSLAVGDAWLDFNGEA
jgi:hypothetical protein